MKSEIMATAIDKMRKKREVLTWRILLCATFFTLHSSLFISCSEQVDEETDEYANWQARNDAYIADIATKYSRLKSYTKDQNVEGAVSDYVYYEVLEEGNGNESPYYSDTVRVSYRGHLISSISYPEGYVFDQTYVGDFSWQTTGIVTSLMATWVDGFTTALQHMHRGDRYLVYVPYALGYGTTTTSSGKIPGCSVLVFDIVLIDYVTNTKSLVPWSSRQL